MSAGYCVTVFYNVTTGKSRRAHRRDITPKGVRFMSDEKYNAAVRWFKLGYGLLPCHPGTKKLITGFGPYQKQIINLKDIEYWFEDREANMAVVAGEGKIILDFDDSQLYRSWSDKYPIVKTTYTEHTPGRGGYHVWLRGELPQGIKWLLDHSAEPPKKRVDSVLFAMAYPSVVDGKQYAAGQGEIMTVQDLQIFGELSEPGHTTPYVLMINQARKEYKSPERIGSVIDRIKESYSIAEMVQEVRPELWHKLQHKGRYMIGNCFLHADHGKHFFIDLQLNYFKCWKCGVQGDTINLYATLKGIDNHEAIEQLKGRAA